MYWKRTLFPTQFLFCHIINKFYIKKKKKNVTIPVRIRAGNSILYQCRGTQDSSFYFSFPWLFFYICFLCIHKVTISSFCQSGTSAKASAIKTYYCKFYIFKNKNCKIISLEGKKGAVTTIENHLYQLLKIHN